VEWATIWSCTTACADVARARTRRELLQVEWAQYQESISLDFSRSNARGRSDLHSPNDEWTPQTHESSGIRQDCAGIAVAAFPSERRLSPRSDLSLGVSRADRRDWLATCDIIHRHSRYARRVPRTRWLAGPGIPQGERRWDSEASSEAAGRRERTALSTV
jgi:hypothetical protein